MDEKSPPPPLRSPLILYAVSETRMTHSCFWVCTVYTMKSIHRSIALDLVLICGAKKADRSALSPVYSCRTNKQGNYEWK